MKYESNRRAVDKAMHRGVREGLLAGAVHYQAQVKLALSKHGSNRTGGGGASPPGQAPAVRTGTLRRSIQVDVGGLIRGNRPHVRIGTNVVYAPIHEFGGTITAKGRGLAVPIHPDAKRASAQGRGPRSFRDLFLIKREGRPPLLAREASGGGIDIMYALPKRVVLPARPFMRPTFRRTVDAIKRAVLIGVRKEVARIGGVG